MAESRLPQGIELSPLDETFRADPYPVLRALREQAPVLAETGLRRFFYTRHDDVREVLRDREFWTDPRKGNPGSFSRELLIQVLAGGEPSMLFMDEPDHRRLRSLVSGSFTPAAVERWRPRIREVVARVLDRIEAAEFDLISEFAGPVPTVVIAEMLGIDPAHHARFKTWSDQSIQAGFNPFATDDERAVRNRARAALDEFFTREIAARREHLGDDLISDMIRAEAQGDQLSEAEMVQQCFLLLVAGNVTTTDLIGNGTKALLDHPAELEKLRADPSLIGNAVEEMLRFDSPVVNTGRIASRDIAIGGCPAGRGESLSTSLAAANRDPAVYPEPDRFDVTREDTHHQSFGGGRHLCLGAHLARAEAQEAILGLLARFPGLRHSDKGFAYHAIPSFRGMRTFWVKV